MRITHVIAEFSRREAMGRTVAETVERVPGDHSIIAAHVHDHPEIFDQVAELGGNMETFPLRSLTELAAALADQQPDIVHVHGGALAPVLMVGTAIRQYRSVATIYAWPHVPPIRSLTSAGLRAAVDSNVLRPRVLATSVLPATVSAALLRRIGVAAVLSPDPRVIDKLSPRLAAPVLRLGSGAPESDRRAHWNGEEPTIVFVGRAETVRGIDTLLAAFPAIAERVPGVRLRLLLLPRPELADIVQAADALGPAVDIVTEGVADVTAEMADAQVGVWPFKFDYTTSPPAMAVAEALSVGLPVVSTDVACVRAVLGPDAPGFLVPPQQPDELARAVIRLLTDEEMWTDVAGRSPAYVNDRLGWHHLAETTEQAYRRALSAV